MSIELIVAEPAAAYAAKAPLVVDCSVVAALLFYEPSRDAAAAALRNKELYAPDLLDHEFANVAVKKAKLGLDGLVEQALENLEQLALIRRRVDTRAQFGLARQFELTAYDAAYLWLAQSLGAPLATFDQRLGTAARKHLGEG